jgi:hypothetical protein
MDERAGTYRCNSKIVDYFVYSVNVDALIIIGALSCPYTANKISRDNSGALTTSGTDGAVT